MLIFLSSMSVLINGSPTTYFEVGRRLHQGDTLSQFFYSYKRDFRFNKEYYSVG